MQQVAWFSRHFDFTSSENIFPSIIERLWGTPVRLEARVMQHPPDMLAQRDGDSWSIKENIGHLSDLEPLWQGRLQDILQGRPELRAADLQNTRTHEAGHNDRPLSVLLDEFRRLRMHTISLIEDLDHDDIFRSSLHPRLKQPMRTMDHFLFVAEHDDHHLARIAQLSRHFMRNAGI